MDMPIYNGRYQNLSLIVERLHFLDSLKFLHMSLKIMPKSFDLT